MLPVSAIHGEGIQNLMDAATAYLPVQSPTSEVPVQETSEADGEAAAPAPRKKGPLRLAIVGRPNVGKSSIINALTKSERVIVSPIPGTTRDSVDVPFEVKIGGDGVAATEKYVLVDTAGIRKTRSIDDSVEFFSVQRSEESIARCDIAILVLDAEAGILEQDKKIADRIVEGRRACILVVNKWDLFEEQIREKRKEEIVSREKKENRSAPKIMTTLGEFGEWVQEKLFFLDYAPVIFTSAKTGFHLDRLLEAVRYVAAQLQQKVPTAILNRTHPRRCREAPASQRCRSPVEILLRHSGAAVAASGVAVRQPATNCFPIRIKNIWRANFAARLVTKVVRLLLCRKRVQKRLNRCGNPSRRTKIWRDAWTRIAPRGTNAIPRKPKKKIALKLVHTGE